MEPRIAELLVRGGIVSRDQLIQAQEKERDNGSSVIRELVRLGFTTEDTLTEFLAKQFNIEKAESKSCRNRGFGLWPCPASAGSKASAGSGKTSWFHSHRGHG